MKDHKKNNPRKNRSGDPSLHELPKAMADAFRSEDIEMEEDLIEQELSEFAIPAKIGGRSIYSFSDSRPEVEDGSILTK